MTLTLRPRLLRAPVSQAGAGKSRLSANLDEDALAGDLPQWAKLLGAEGVADYPKQ